MPSFGELLPGTSPWYGTAEYFYATKFTLGEAITITSISFYVLIYGGTPHNVRTALYTDVDGHPTNLLTASAVAGVSVTAANTWVQATVPPYDAAPGLYWIAIVVESDGEAFAMRTPGDVANQTKSIDVVPLASLPDLLLPVWGEFRDQVMAVYASGPAAVAPDLIAQMV